MSHATSRARFLAAALGVAVSAMLAVGWASETAERVGAAGASGRASVFVSNVDGDTVSVIDPVTQTEVAAIPVGSEPRNLAPTPDGSRIYVPNRFGNSVTVIDTATNSVVTTVTDASFDEPYAATVTPNGAEAYIANKEGGGSATGSVTVIDTATNTVSGPIDDPCFSSPEGIVADPTRARVYLVNRNTNASTEYQVCIIDTGSKTVTGAVSVGSEPRFGVVTPDGAFLYTSNNASGDISKVALADNSVTTITTGGSPRNMALSNDGSKVYVPLQDGGIAVVSVATDGVNPISFTGALSTYGVAVLPGTNLGYVTDEDGNQLFVFDTSTDTELTGPGFPVMSTSFDTPRAATAVGNPVTPTPPSPPPAPTPPSPTAPVPQPVFAVARFTG